MDMLCAFQAKDPQTCAWVLANTNENTTNLTEKRWREASKQYLESLSDGPDLVSTGVDSGDGDSVGDDRKSSEKL